MAFYLEEAWRWSMMINFVDSDDAYDEWWSWWLWWLTMMIVMAMVWRWWISIILMTQNIWVFFLFKSNENYWGPSHEIRRGFRDAGNSFRKQHVPNDLLRIFRKASAMWTLASAREEFPISAYLDYRGKMVLIRGSIGAALFLSNPPMSWFPWLVNHCQKANVQIPHAAITFMRKHA